MDLKDRVGTRGQPFLFRALLAAEQVKMECGNGWCGTDLLAAAADWTTDDLMNAKRRPRDYERLVREVEMLLPESLENS